MVPVRDGLSVLTKVSNPTFHFQVSLSSILHLFHVPDACCCIMNWFLSYSHRFVTVNGLIYICRVPQRLRAIEDPCMEVTSYGSFGALNEPNEILERALIASCNSLKYLWSQTLSGLSFSHGNSVLESVLLAFILLANICILRHFVVILVGKRKIIVIIKI